MANLCFDERTLELGIAYFGPPKAGSGTNVRHLHRVTPARAKAELRRVGGGEPSERMWVFHYLPPDPPKLPGFDTRIRVCSVPSGTQLTVDRDATLAGIDGIVFVADARAGRTEENLAALLDLDQLLARAGVELAGLPMVFQINQTDAQNARPPERVAEELNPLGLPVFEAMARQGRGVFESHEAIVNAVLARLRDHLGSGELHVRPTSVSRGGRERVEEAIVGHAASLPQARRPAPASLAFPSVAEIPVRLVDLRGSRPVQHVRTELRDGRVRVESVFRRPDGSHRKLALLIEPGEESAPVPSPTATRRQPTPLLPTPPPPPAEELGELSREFYGVVGIVGGMLAGFFLHYILFT